MVVHSGSRFFPPSRIQGLKRALIRNAVNFILLFFRQLNKMLPLPSLQHLKRVKSYWDPRDGPRILLLLWQLQDDQARE
jgi:hypothetical protein